MRYSNRTVAETVLLFFSARCVASSRSAPPRPRRVAPRRGGGQTQNIPRVTTLHQCSAVKTRERKKSDVAHFSALTHPRGWGVAGTVTSLIYRRRGPSREATACDRRMQAPALFAPAGGPIHSSE